MMSENFYLKWNDFKDIRISAFGNLRNNVDFADVILACGDGQQEKSSQGSWRQLALSFRTF